MTLELETGNHENRYVPGAVMALYEAIEVKETGDTEDAAFEGVEVIRDKNGNVKSITVKERYAGSRYEYVRTEGSGEEESLLPGLIGDGTWTMKEIPRGIRRFCFMIWEDLR